MKILIIAFLAVVLLACDTLVLTQSGAKTQNSRASVTNLSTTETKNTEVSPGVLASQIENKQIDLLAVFNAYSGVGEKKTFNWNGTWNYQTRGDSGSILIKSVSNKEFNFALMVSHGANTGEINGIAKIKGKMAYFKSETNKQLATTPVCELLFINNGRLIQVQQNEGCYSFGGIGVVFGGEYSKGISAKKQRENAELKQPLLPDAKLNESFKRLVGADYKKIFETFQVTYENEEKDLDGFGASILTGGVSGLFTIMEGIIIYDKTGKMWAAILNPEQETVNYYTNDSNYLGKLPQTIQTWKDKKQPKWSVVFKSGQKK